MQTRMQPTSYPIWIMFEMSILTIYFPPLQPYCFINLPKMFFLLDFLSHSIFFPIIHLEHRNSHLTAHIFQKVTKRIAMSPELPKSWQQERNTENFNFLQVSCDHKNFCGSRSRSSKRNKAFLSFKKPFEWIYAELAAPSPLAAGRCYAEHWAAVSCTALCCIYFIGSIPSVGILVLGFLNR